MSYKCPRCGEPVHRGYNRGAQMTAGLIGAAFYAAFGSFVCKKCGKIAKEEFSPEERRKMTNGTILLVIGGLALIGLVIWLWTIS